MRDGNLEVHGISEQGPFAGQRAKESGVAGHVASAAEERCRDCVYETGQLAEEVVDKCGEYRGSGAICGRCSGSSTAEVACMPGIGVLVAYGTRSETIYPGVVAG